MRVIAMIVLIITLLAGAFFGYCYFGTQMRVEGVGTAVTPAADVLGTYDDILARLENGTFMGTVFHEPDFATEDSFAFVTYTVRMSNRGIMPMDWITISVSPGMMDVVQLPQDRTPSLAAGTRSDFSATVMTRAGADTQRRITITYYVLGAKRTVTFDAPAN